MRKIRFVAAAAVALAACPLRAAEPPATESRTQPITRVIVGFSPRILPQMDIKDARASMAVWFKKIVKNIGEDVPTDILVLNTDAEVDTAIREKRIDVLVCLSTDTMVFCKQYGIVPEYSGATGSNPLSEFVLLSARRAGIDSVKKLRGRRVVLQTGGWGPIPAMWLDCLLSRNGLPAAPEALLEVRGADKPAQAVLPVFFGRADACVVTRGAFDTMAELNPQIRSRLRVVATSPEYLRAVGSFVARWDQESRKRFRDRLADFHRDPAGQHVLTLFKSDKLVFLKDEHFDGVRSLVEEHRKVLRKSDPGTEKSGGEKRHTGNGAERSGAAKASVRGSREAALEAEKRRDHTGRGG